MCYMSAFPSNVQPVLERLLNSLESNDDGAGFTIALKSGQLITEHAVGVKTYVEGTYKNKKGEVLPCTNVKIDPKPMEKLAERFVKLRERHPEGPALWHARMATGGVDDTRGCHPYKTGGDIKGTVLAHNGILFSVPQGDWRSDTRIFAEDILPRQFRKFWRPQVRDNIEKFLGNGNKIAIITVNQNFMTRKQGVKSREPFELFIFNEELGHWTEDGAWHSNNGYQSYKASARGYWWDDDDASSGVYTQGQGWNNDREWSGHGAYESGLGYVVGGMEWTTKDGTVVGSEQDRRDFNHGAGSATTCDMCGVVGAVDIYTEWCEVCGTCNGCSMMTAVCECYNPHNATQPANIPSIAARKVLPELTAGTRSYYNLSPDEQRADFLKRCWDEFENDPTVDDITWEQYVALREYEEAEGVEVTFENKEQEDAWLAERAAMARLQMEDEMNAAIATARDQAEDDKYAAALKRAGGEHGPEGDDPGIITRLS